MQSIKLIGTIGPVGIGTIGIGTFEMENPQKMAKCGTGWFQSEPRIHEHLELDQKAIRL